LPQRSYRMPREEVLRDEEKAQTASAAAIEKTGMLS
jgi:hypothetical protein